MPSKRETLERQLRELEERGITVAIAPLDDDGQAAATGRSRVQEYRPTTQEIIVDLPTREGRPVEMKIGSQVRVVFVSKGVLYEFQTQILDRLIHRASQFPLPALKLQAPKAVRIAGGRRNVRIQPLDRSRPELRWRLQGPDGKASRERAWHKAGLHDLSARSVGLLLSEKDVEQLPPGTRIEVAVRPRNSKKPLIVLCRVERVGSGGDDPTDRLVGLEIELADTSAHAGHPELGRLVAEWEREIARNLSRACPSSASIDVEDMLWLWTGTYHSQQAVGGLGRRGS